MKLEKKYYKDFDFLRVVSCIAVLLYHFNILKGGYLAVCLFFVMSGYLSCVSAFRKEKFSLVKYYKDRLLRVYLPLVIVVFITLFVVSFVPQITWISLKPEATSVLLGYNNFWQLTANLDYFARHINSPFMHFWYTSILLQFELLFPILFLLLKKCGKKKKMIPCIIASIISVLCTVHFYYESQIQNIMIVYYDTFTRLFSILFGISLGFIQHYYGQLIPKKLQKTICNRILFYFYIILLICLFYTVDASSKLFPISMIFILVLV